jgi:hypothetical protein
MTINQPSYLLLPLDTNHPTLTKHDHTLIESILEGSTSTHSPGTHLFLVTLEDSTRKSTIVAIKYPSHYTLLHAVLRRTKGNAFVASDMAASQYETFKIRKKNYHWETP